DIRREIITLNWQVTSQKENKLGLTFPEAGYATPGAQVPLFFKSFQIENQNHDIRFILENPQFEEITEHNLKPYFSEIPEKPEIKKTRLKSGNLNKIEL